MGQSRITTDSPAGVLLGRLLVIDVFLQGFRASRRSSVTDKVRRDLLRKKKKKESKSFASSTGGDDLLVIFCWSKVVIVRCIHPADDLLAAGA